MGRLNAQSFFSDSEKERISAAVVAAEAGTSGEIATMVVDESDSYKEAEMLGGLLLAGLLGLVIAVVFRHVTIWTYIPAVCLLFFPSRLLFKMVPRLKLLLVGRKRVEEAVRERAVRAFYEKELHRTREQTGILIFISLLEHKVWILGDRGINEKLAPESWKEFALKVAGGIKEGRGCDALCSVIAECGVILAQSFPARPGDINELTDKVLH